MKLIHVAADRWNFQDEDGTFYFPIGGNMLNDEHPGAGTLFDHFDADDCERRFAVMQEWGLNNLRQAIGVNHVFDAKTGLKAEGMRNWQTFIGLAEKCGVRLQPVGGYPGSNDWFDNNQVADDGESLDNLEKFWSLFVPEFKSHPAIFAWDIHNELWYHMEEHMTIGGGESDILGHFTRPWAEYLQTKYGTVAEMNKHYQAWATYERFTDVPFSVLFKDMPGNPLGYDMKMFLNEKGYKWAKKQVDAIRAASPQHMVVSGDNGWLFPDMDLLLSNGFNNFYHHELYDFVSVHPYPAPQCLETGHGDPLNGGEALIFWLNSVVAMARIDFYEKPVMLQEFGWYGGGESAFLCKLPYRSEEEHADYMRTLMTRLAPHTNGFINWPTCDMPRSDDISNHGGIFTADMKPKALAHVYKELGDTYQGTEMTRQQGTKTVTYSLLQLTTSRQYQDDMWTEIDQLSRQGEILDFRFI